MPVTTSGARTAVSLRSRCRFRSPRRCLASAPAPLNSAAASAAAARRHYDGLAWVRTRQEAVDQGWFGGPLTDEVASRLGDVVIAPREHVAVLDPSDPGEQWMRCRHGSLTPEEMLVPLLASRG